LPKLIQVILEGNLKQCKPLWQEIVRIMREVEFNLLEIKY